MKVIPHKTVKAMIAGMVEAAAAASGTWDTWHARHCQVDAVLEMPIGDLLNPAIQGYVWTWNMKKAITTARIEKGDRLAANGLGGKVVVRTTLITALLAAKELPDYHYRILIDRDTLKGLK